jgi:hypothetical protein
MSITVCARFIRGILAAAAAAALFSLASCATVFTDQDTLRGYPYQSLRTVTDAAALAKSGSVKNAALPVPGLSFAASGNQAFPDLYVFAEQSQAPALYKALLQGLPPLLQATGNAGAAGLDPALLAQVNQILVYQPNGANSIQGVLIGHFAVELLRVGLLSQPDLKQRLVPKADGSSVFLYENGAGDVHIALISNEFIAFQKDLKGSAAMNLARFNSHAQRVISFASGEFTPIINILAEKKEAIEAARDAMKAVESNGNAGAADPLAVPAELLNSSATAFEQVLVTEKPRKALFALASVAMPAGMPMQAVRLRLEPVKVKQTDPETAAETEQALVDFQASLLPRAGLGAKALKTGIKFALVAFADMAGLDASFLAQVDIAERDGLVVITGLRVKEDAAAALISELVKLGGQAASGAEVWKPEAAEGEAAGSGTP